MEKSFDLGVDLLDTSDDEQVADVDDEDVDEADDNEKLPIKQHKKNQLIRGFTLLFQTNNSTKIRLK